MTKPILYNKESICQQLGDSSVPEQIHFHRSLPSTNTTAKEMALAGAPAGTVVIAEHQSAGRGRLGRDFFSPADTGLYLSIILRPQLAASGILYATAATAVIAARTVEALTPARLSIKWVNDLFRGDRKVGGILAETAFAGDGSLSYLVIGIGLNITPNPVLPPELCEIVGTLYDEAPARDLRSSLAAGLIGGLNNLFSHDRSNLMADYKKRSLVLGREVVLTSGQQVMTGRVSDFDGDGRLILRTEDGQEKIIGSGEVTLRLATQARGDRHAY